MGVSIKNLLNKRKRGNIALVAVVMIIVPVIVTSIAQLLLSTESYRIKTERKLTERYTDISIAEIMAYEAVKALDGQYLDTVNLDTVKEQCENKVLAELKKEVQIQIESNIVQNGSIQLKAQVESDKKPVIILENIELIEEIIGEAENQITRYILNFSGSSIRRAVSYD